MEPARVYLHDGAYRRIGQLTTAASINRSFGLMRTGVASVLVAADDPLAGELDPRSGRVLAIESGSYPPPWVGKIAAVRASPAQGTLRVTAKGLETLLAHRPLGVEASFSGTTSAVFAQIIALAGAANPHGIAVHPGNPPGPRFEAEFPDRRALTAIQSLVRQSGWEWWLEHDVRHDGIDVVAFCAPERGVDAYDTATLTEAGNCDVQSWQIDGEAASFAQTVVGGASSVTQAYAERPRSSRQAEAFSGRAGVEVVAAATVHGYSVERSATAESALTRIERIAVAESLKAEGIVQDAASALVARPPAPERSVRLNVYGDPAVWPWLVVGNVVHLQAPGAFLDGYDGPVRVAGVQPMEEQGDLDVEAEVLRAK